VKARWDLQIDRIVVTGATGRMPATGELRALIERAVNDAVGNAAWPAGRAAHAAIRVSAPALRDGSSIAQAVGRGVSQALKGRSHG
jgi:hypothetical protein